MNLRKLLPLFDGLRSPESSASYVVTVLLVNYIAWLLVPSSPMPQWSTVLAAAILFGFLFTQTANVKLFFPLVALAGFILLFFSAIGDWDARSIWLFHAKRMFFDGTVEGRFDGYAPMIKPSYPDFVPAAMASVARIAGVWNEVLPKVAIFLCTMPPLITILAVIQSLGIRLLLLGTILFVTQGQLLSGYMDAPLALYIVAALSLLWQVRECPDRRALLVPSAVFIAAAACIKEEGIAMALIVAVPWLLLVLRPNRMQALSKKALVVAGLSLVPWVVWHLMLVRAGVHSQTLATGSIARGLSRVASGEAGLVKRSIWNAISKAVTVTILAAYLRRKFSLEIVWFFVAYSGLLAMVYLVTPFDLAWHIGTSIHRVTLVLNLLSVVFFSLEFQAWTTTNLSLKQAAVRESVGAS